MLTLPLKNTSDEVVGVVQLINKKKNPLNKLDLSGDPTSDILPFSDEDIELATSLGSQAGVAIENVRLMDAITSLFERFVIACVQAVEQRDPATAGHSGRVDRITMALADEVNRAKQGPYGDVMFSDAEMVELHYASLLHDFGKIGVREHVLTKAEKLYPAQAQAIDFRAKIIERELKLDALEREAQLFIKGKPTDAELQAIRDDVDAKIASLKDDHEFVRKHIKPVFVTDEAEARLKQIHENPWKIGDDQFMLIDDEWNEITELGAIGEIAIKGHNVMKGYLGNPEATAWAIKDGWFRTGDLARRDEENYYFIVDRAKDMIIRGGYNVYPREVEEVLYEHPAVATAAVVGIPHPSLGEEVAAAITLKPGATATEDELRDFAKERVAAYKYPRVVWVTSELPMGPTGKILKREIDIPTPAAPSGDEFPTQTLPDPS